MNIFLKICLYFVLTLLSSFHGMCNLPPIKLDRLELGDQMFDIGNSTLDCLLAAKDENIPDEIEDGIQRGNRLIKYIFLVDANGSNPLRDGMDVAYKGDHWTLTTTLQGKTLLSLAFDYGPLSLMTLTFGVEELDVLLEERPGGCLGHLSEKQKIEAVLLSGVRNFRSRNHPVAMKEGHSLCHQVIQRNGHYAFFTYQCCAPTPDGQTVLCSINNKNKWIAAIDILLIVVKVLAFLTIVSVAPKMLLSSYRNARQVPYVIHRKVPLEKIVHFRCLKIKDKMNIKRKIEKCSKAEDSGNGQGKKEVKQTTKQSTIVSWSKGKHGEEFPKCKVAIDLRKENKKRFKRCKDFIIKNCGENESKSLKVKIKEYRILVEYERLQGEQNIPVGFVRSIFRAIFLCALEETDPFEKCCKASVLSSLYESLSWIEFWKPIGAVLMVIFVPFPFYIRLLFFYLFERQEVLYQHERAKQLGLMMDPTSFNLMDVLLPDHPLCIVIYLLYISTVVVLGMLALKGDKRKLQNIFYTSLSDLEAVSKVDIAKHFLKQLLLPFTKCGIFGCLLYPIFLIIYVPILLLGHILFVVPLIHLNIRFIMTSRDFVLGTKRKCVSMKRRHSEEGNSSFHDFVGDTIPLLEIKTQSPGFNQMSAVGKREIPLDPNCLRAFFRALGILLMMATSIGFSILAGECIGFAAEILFFTLMGILANAGVYLQYVSLVLLITVYSHNCFSSVHKRYMTLNQSIFSEIKRALSDDIAAVTKSKAEYQENTAFKSSTYSEAVNKEKEQVPASDKEDGVRQETKDDNGNEEDAQASKTTAANDEVKLEISSPSQNDTEKKKAALWKEDDVCPERYWDLDDVLFFVDREDRPRIPRKLFQKICAIKVDGSPGPIHLAMLESLRHFLFMVSFLALVFIAISSFGAIYQVNSTNRMLATIAGGLVPLLMRTFLKAEVSDIKLNTVSFQNKLNEVFHDLEQKWLINDLPMEDGELVSNPSESDIVVLYSNMKGFVQEGATT